MSNSITISACLIVKDEEKFLPDSLRALQSAVDEVIVVDTGSKDKTPAIVQQFGAKLFHFPWNEHFADARNYSLAQASGDWILIVDADEILLNPQELRPFLSQLDPQIGGAFVQLLSPSSSQHSDQRFHLDFLLRLVRNHPDIRFEGRIHEQILPSVQRAGYKLTLSPIQLYHRGYALSPDQMRRKAERNLTLLDRQLHENPEDGYTWFQHGKTALLLGNLEQAQQDFAKALQLLPPDHLTRIQTLNSLAWIELHKKHFAQAKHLLRSSLAQLPNQSFAHYLLGELYFQTQRYPQALEAYQQMHHFAEHPSALAAIAGDLLLPKADRLFLLGKTHLLLGNPEQAEALFQEGIQHTPESYSCWVGLADVAKRRKQFREALAYLRKAQQLAPHHPQIPQYIAQVERELQSATSTLSLCGCILTRQLSEPLQRAIASLLPICDQVLIGITTTLPATLPEWISQNPKISLYEIPWNDDFSQARNTLLDRCPPTQWICVLDDDETIPPESQQKILALLPSLDPTIGGIWVRMQHLTTDAEDHPASETAVLRIFRSHPQIRYRGIIHETPLHSILEAGFQLYHTTEIIFHHHTAPPDASKTALYRRLYQKALATPLNEQHKLSTLFHYLLFLLTLPATPSDIAEAERFFQTEDFNHLSALQQATLWNALIRAKLKEENFDEIATLAAHSIAAYPEQCEAYWYRFLAATYLGNPTEAFESIQQYLQRIEKYQSKLPFEKLPPISQVREVIAAAQRVYQLPEIIHAPNHTPSAEDTASSHPPVSIPSPQIQQNTPAPSPLLSLCMIVRNEEHNLPGCLESVQGLVDEIIIVDTGSTDRTLDIAQQFNAKIFTMEWKNDFSAARNKSIQHAAGQWILYLDADERIEREQIPMIRELLESASSEIGAFTCTIVSKHRLSDTESSVHRGVYPRIFRNLGYPTIHFRGKVHEQISPSILEAGKKIASSPILIHHLGYDIPEEQLRAKVRRNYQLLFAHIQEHPTDAYAWFQLGQTLNWMHLPDQAAQALTFSLQLSPPLPHYLQAAAYAILAQLAGRRRDFASALAYAERSLQLAPEQLYARALKAFALLHLGRKDEAKTLFEECLAQLKQSTARTLRSGFDIDVSETELRKGLAMCE